MKRIIFLFILILMGSVSFAEVSFVKITDENSYSSVKDFSNTYEININEHGTGSIAKCQSVRLAKNWFITAAHCIANTCKNGCSFRARLIVGSNYEADITTTHSKGFSEKIFYIPQDKYETAHNDIALIFFDPKDTKLVFKDPNTNEFISKNLFFTRLPNTKPFFNALDGVNLPPILALPNTEDLQILRDLSIVSIWSGKRNLLENKDDPVFYSQKLGCILTKNFGIIQGISGSGVMTNTGELLGIVSAKADLVQTDSDGKTISIPLAFIAPFDADIIKFIKQHISFLEIKQAKGDDIIRKPSQKQTEMIDQIAKSLFRINKK